MNLNLLIDALVRQTMVLIAQLATKGGVRSPLSHVANQVFLDLSKELQAHGLGRKVIADMFGLTLRAYRLKTQRLTASSSRRNQSLWEAMLVFLEDRQTVTRRDILKRFRRDDPEMVVGLLNDLVESGFLFRAGDGADSLFRIVTPEDLKSSSAETINKANDALVWVAVHRHGPLTVEALSNHFVTIGDDVIRESLQRLAADGRVQSVPHEGQTAYLSKSCVIPFYSSEGWEAAVLDHFQAMTTAIAAKARGDQRAALNDLNGGSTYHFDLDEQHPLLDEVHSLFRRFREDCSGLRQRILTYNASATHEVGLQRRVTLYVGQHVVEEEPE